MTHQTAEITIYQVPFVRSKNPIFERDSPSDFTAFLEQYKISTYKIQFQRLESNMSVILPTPFAGFSANYALIKSTTIAPNKSTINYRFSYIVGRHVVASNSVKIDLELDYLNTYWFLDKLSPRTYVIREHRNRFLLSNFSFSATSYFSRKVDYVDEGFKPSLYKKSDSKILSDEGPFQNKNFYLVYKSRSDLTAGATQPIACYLVCDDRLRAYKGAASPDIELSALGNAQILPTNKVLWLFSRDNADIEIYDRIQSADIIHGYGPYMAYSLILTPITLSGATHNYVTLKGWTQDATTGKVVSTTILDNIVATGLVLQIASGYRATDSESVLTDDNTITEDEILEVNFVLLGVGTGEYQWNLSLEDIDRSDSRLMKIIKLPYNPTSASLSADLVYSFSGFVFDTNLHLYTLVNLSTEFGIALPSYTLGEAVTSISVPAQEALYTTDRYLLDSKLYASTFYYVKMVYDSFSLTIPLENCEFYTDIQLASLDITFKPSNTITTRFAFMWTSGEIHHYLETEDYAHYLIVARNNELPIYSSSYLDYLRQGYNYDVKNKNIADISRWVGFGLNTLGAGIQLATGTEFGISSGITSLSSGLSSAILGQIQSDTKMEETLHNKSLQSANVSGADDSDLLDFYEGNALHFFEYACRDEIATSLDNFFYYYGYATNRYEIPNYNSRLNFNYLECVAEFLPTLTLNVSIIDAIKRKLKEGVTIFHYHSAITGGYDYNQIYENFETFFEK